MHFILLTHSRELSKQTATGPLVKQALENQCDIIEWSRTIPDSRLTTELDTSKTLLIYPDTHSPELVIKDTKALIEFDTFIILDGTWQEAKKMYNRSPYLHSLAHYQLEVSYLSSYQLRRNQKSIGLCTAEVAIELLKQKSELAQASKLEDLYNKFNSGIKVEEKTN
ncbi:MAG: DTW domain-containing protein [Marinomonas sp.]|uniref:DTW domain-containing protein n=1 Tax=unclassified Marinomonas TaxID=196814 RepID=UPI0007AF77F9|nr:MULTISPECIES: tRNA-uridine aminocarboxypropyltransferase [unclassified Marinomonas]KZM40071.1 hypothetical protein OA92_18625 [Marinomonas sp. SBI22]KZM41365.1 hypothetical protein OA91_17860 [Marinomonas sp. SBI8L]